MPTPHNAAHKGDIAEVVLMPGDPLRAQFIAQNYLEDATCFNTVRNMLGFTGTYRGKRVSVMGSGMGVPSMSIYAHELYNFYDVDAIIRIGTVGGIAPQVKLRDIIMAQAVCTNSSVVSLTGLPGTFAPIADFGLLRQAVEAAEKLGAPYHVGNMITTDLFYNPANAYEEWAKLGVLGCEMETAGLYLCAARAQKRALAIATVSDLPLTGEGLDAEQRQVSFTQMMEVALEVAAG